MSIPNFFLISPEKKLYIIPTFDGIKLFIVNMILLVIGLIYANNYVLLFNFLLFCLFIASMFYTHFNLQHLNASNISIGEVFTNREAVMSIQLESREKNVRTAIVAKAYINHFFFVSIPNDYTLENQYLNLEFKVSKRGKYPLKRIMLQTEFPFHLFKCFIYFNFHHELIVYPELKNNLKIKSFLENSKSGDLSDYSIRDYRRGDNANRILWKKSNNEHFIVREFHNEIESGVVFEINSLIPETIEDELSNITSLIYDCHLNKVPFGIVTKNIRIEASSFDKTHLKKCLEELAVFEC